MTRLSFALVLLVVMDLAISTRATAVEKPAVKVMVSAGGCTEEKVSLRVSMTNQGETTLTVYKSSLPWESQDAVLLVAVTHDDEARVLKRTSFLLDYPPDIVKLSPGSQVTGALDLTFNYPSLWEELKHRDIVIFWSYTLETVDGAKSARNAGSIGLGRLRRESASECRVF